ncbi:MAG: hypothetical protein AB8H80_14495 [Planctomycetota bacterium]
MTEAPMPKPNHRSLLRLLACFGVLGMLAGAAVAQADARRADIDKAMAKNMVGLARRASVQKAHSLAREIAQRVIDNYAADHPQARRLLGQRKMRGAWQSDGKPVPKDAAKGKRLLALKEQWQLVQKHAGKLHKEYALALAAEGADKAVQTSELELALSYLPNDESLHKELGHKQVGGAWVQQNAAGFVSRMRDIFGRAVELRGFAVECQAVADTEVPVELKNMGIPMFGARSARYTYFSSDSYEAAQDLCTWSERSHELLEYLLGPEKAAVRSEAWKWHCVLRTPEERDSLLSKSPNTRGPFTVAQAQLFVGIGFRCESGGRASATWQPQGLDRDHAVANVTKRHFLDQRNEGLGEGLMHVTTWLLCGSTHTYFADLPKTSVDGVLMPRDTDKWRERLWTEIAQGKDMPLAVVPRERAESFRDSTRIKSWGFMLWMLARYPDKWLPLINACGAPKLTPEGVDLAFEEVLGKSPVEVEQDWRKWARRDSAIGEATGWADHK